MTKASQHCAVAPTPVLSGVVLGFARPVGSHHPVLHVHAPLRYSGHRSAPWSQLQAPELLDLAASRSLRQPPGIVSRPGPSPHGSAGFSGLTRFLLRRLARPVLVYRLPLSSGVDRTSQPPAFQHWDPGFTSFGFHRYGLASTASGPRHDLCGVATLRPPRSAGYPRVCRFTER